jgi:competence protein ComEA
MHAWNLLRQWRVGALAATATMLCLAATEVNDADEAELDSVKGLGPATTARILKAREHGPFKDWADFLKRVKGIKAKAAEHLSEGGLTVNGAPYDAAKGLRTQP